jgi:hypothetical protein
MNLSKRFGAAIGVMFLIGAGCQSDTSSIPSEPPAAKQVSPDQHGKLMGALEGYQLPAQSIAATSHPDPAVQQVIVRMSQIAQSQGLVFDGSRANEGIVIVGKQGSGYPILLAVSVYNTPRGVATQDTSRSNGLDYREGMKMKERFFGAL